MSERVETGVVTAGQAARESPLRQAANGIRYATWGDTRLDPAELDRLIDTVPAAIGAALAKVAYYFVPLAIAARDLPGAGHRSTAPEETRIASAYSDDLAEEAICHRNVTLPEGEAVFLSARLLSDKFAISFEFFINTGHGFVETAGVPESFAELVWAQALSDVRGETSQDAWESRLGSLENRAARRGDALKVDEKARQAYMEAAFADAIAIYLLSLALDFSYSELREREYPLLAPQPLAERLRHVAELFPPNPGYEFSIRYRRHA